MNWNLSNVPWSRLWNCILAWKLPLTVDPSQRSKDVQGLTVGPSASRYSRMTQFHRDQAYDVWEVVPPFMQDGTYLSRNSATLGPLTSQPPCVGRLTGRCRIQLDRLESSVGGTQCKRSVGGSVAEKSLSGNLRTRSFHIPSAISFSIFGLSPTRSFLWSFGYY